jgi:hypothetical protein
LDTSKLAMKQMEFLHRQSEIENEEMSRKIFDRDEELENTRGAFYNEISQVLWFFIILIEF